MPCTKRFGYHSSALIFPSSAILCMETGQQSQQGSWFFTDYGGIHTHARARACIHARAHTHNSSVTGDEHTHTTHTNAYSRGQNKSGYRI